MGNEVVLDQGSGTKNKAFVQQLGSGSRMEITQVGEYNYFWAKDYGINNLIYNTTKPTQEGSENQIDAILRGQNASVELTQTGDRNFIGLEDNTVTIQQCGSTNCNRTE